MPMPDESGRVAVTFQEDPVRYLQGVYNDLMKRNDDLRDINRDNRLFYEGQDKDLETRASDKRVVRSSLFIHELKPAIDTRVADVVSKLEEREFPVTFRPKNHTPTPEESAQALWIERTINEQLRECGYLCGGFRDHILASEVYRSPATVKVGWENVYEERQAEVVQPTQHEIINAALAGREFKPRVKFVDKFRGGRPYVELLPPDQFLYEANVAYFHLESENPAHVTWMSWNKLMAVAKDLKWDIDKLKEMREELLAADTESPTNDTFEEEIKKEQEIPIRPGYRDGKFLVVEFYVRYYDDDGSEVIRQVIMVGNKEIVSNKNSPYKGIRFPFAPITANPFPGSIEGLSSVDVAKSMQQLYNELFNSFLDGVSYRIFPPIIRRTGTTFSKSPVWSPGAIWDIDDPEGLRPFIENPGVMPDLPSLMAAVSEKIREVLNAHDIQQGFQSQQYEKATSTSLRASGANRRAMPTRKRYGMALVEVAKMFLALNQQYHPNAALFAMPLIVDVPSLTNITDPENEKQEALLIMTQALQLPMYQSPTGQLKIRNMFEDVVELFKKTDVPRYVPTEEEIQSDMDAQKDVQLAAMEKQAAQEELALSAQGGQQ